MTSSTTRTNMISGVIHDPTTMNGREFSITRYDTTAEMIAANRLPTGSGSSRASKETIISGNRTNFRSRPTRAVTETNTRKEFCDDIGYIEKVIGWNSVRAEPEDIGNEIHCMDRERSLIDLNPVFAIDIPDADDVIICYFKT